LRKLQLFILFFLSLNLVACSNARSQITPAPDSRNYVLDPVFRELYDFLGGKNVLGEAISPAKQVNGVVSQYVTAGLMIFDRDAPARRKFQFGALGKDFGIISPGDSELVVAAPFQDFYDQLRGETFVGLPITGAVFNEEKNRTEQYFENLGFYQGPETDGAVRLLPYGAWSCGDECQSSLSLNASPLVPAPTITSSTPQVPANKPSNLQHPTDTPQSPLVTPPAPHKWLVRVWESKQMVSSTQEQEIVLSIQRDGVPLQGASATLVVSLPDGAIRSNDFSPTDASGMARLKVAPIQAQNGALIPYQVCIYNESGDQYCIQQNYMIWTTP
jgi:hypothetical protein